MDPVQPMILFRYFYEEIISGYERCNEREVTKDALKITVCI